MVNPELYPCTCGRLTLTRSQRGAKSCWVCDPNLAPTIQRGGIDMSNPDDPEKAQEWLQARDQRVYSEAVEYALTHARQVVSQYLATAEKWRYDRVMWAFGVMLGEIPEDTPEPVVLDNPIADQPERTPE